MILSITPFTKVISAVKFSFLQDLSNAWMTPKAALLYAPWGQSTGVRFAILRTCVVLAVFCNAAFAIFWTIRTSSPYRVSCPMMRFSHLASVLQTLLTGTPSVALAMETQTPWPKLSRGWNTRLITLLKQPWNLQKNAAVVRIATRHGMERASFHGNAVVPVSMSLQILLLN